MPRFFNPRLAAVVLAGFSAFLGLYAPQPMLPLLKDVFHLSTTTTSQVVSYSTMAVAIAAPFMGMLSDRFGRKKVLIPAAFFLAIPSMLAATSATFGQLLFWRFWQGVFTPGVQASTIAYISEEWPGGPGQAMSAYVAGTIMGGYLGRMITAFIATNGNWRGAMLALGLINFACAIGMWAWLPSATKARVHHEHPPVMGVIASHLRNPKLIGIYCVGFCVLYTMIGSLTYINFRLAAPPFNWNTASLGLLFTIYLLAAVITLRVGKKLDVFGHQRAAIGALCLMLTGILITLSGYPPVIMLGLTLICSGVFIAQAASNSFIGKAAAQGRAIAVGLYTTFYYIGGSFGALIPGIAWTRAGWPGTVASIAGLQIVTITFAAVFWRAATRRYDDAIRRTSGDAPA